MYKRKGCDVWTLTERDFNGYEFYQTYDREIGYILYNLSIYTDILKHIDIILEISGNRYLGYLDIEYFTKNSTCDFSLSDILQSKTAESKIFLYKIPFVICQENYLEDVKIVKEIEL